MESGFRIALGVPRCNLCSPDCRAKSTIRVGSFPAFTRETGASFAANNDARQPQVRRKTS